MLAKFSGKNLKGPYLSLEKEKDTFCVVLTYSIKQASESRKFHVTTFPLYLVSTPITQFRLLQSTVDAIPLAHLVVKSEKKTYKTNSTAVGFR